LSSVCLEEFDICVVTISEGELFQRFAILLQEK